MPEVSKDSKLISLNTLSATFIRNSFLMISPLVLQVERREFNKGSLKRTRIEAKLQTSKNPRKIFKLVNLLKVFN